MTLYYSIVFGLLMAEMAAFVILVAPLPGSLRSIVVKFVRSNPLVQKMRAWLRFTFIAVLVLFVDSVNRVWRVQEEMKIAKARQAGAVSDRDEVLARKFYAQRNMYLCGFTLFLSWILIRTFSLLRELLEKSGHDTDASIREQLKKKTTELEALKKQSGGLTNEYNRVSDELHKNEPVVDKKNQ